MIGWVFTVVMVWHAVLVLVLLVHVARSRRLATKLVAFDGVSLVLISALVMLSAHRGDVLFIEIGLVLAMLMFAQTVAVARLLRARRLVE